MLLIILIMSLVWLVLIMLDLDQIMME